MRGLGIITRSCTRGLGIILPASGRLIKLYIDIGGTRCSPGYFSRQLSHVKSEPIMFLWVRLLKSRSAQLWVNVNFLYLNALPDYLLISYFSLSEVSASHTETIIKECEECNL